ncbi:MAG TPA: sulfatase-like hydrolase/transferase, partial [Allosphingosinicella sp.]|nr:sulfatase-like hydrolase/transferase [Allosphingosinicella sp.]
AGDTDWDNSTIWLSRWYHRLWRFPRARQRDRPVFRAAARRIAALGRSGRPFLASLVSVANHTPFLSRESGFDMAGRASSSERILNTTRYTDDVLREFFGALEAEPWFARTLVIVVGDHGFNLGEHRTPVGQLSLYRESVWVPLLIVGPHERLPRGRIGKPVSLLDVAPTVADLLGLREPVPWQGHSLAGGSGSSLLFAQRGWRLAEAAGWSAVAAPGAPSPELFDRRRDWLQRSPVRGREAMARALIRKAEDMSRLNDHALRHDRVWR